MEQGNINFTREFKKQGVVPGHLYKATVIDNMDPLEVGRVRARIDGFMNGIEDDHLPWAISRFQHPHGAFPTSDDCGGSGSFSVPAIGTYVFLVWQSEDPHTPTYQSYTVDKKTVIGLAKEDYPDTHVIYRFLNCAVLTINTKTHEAYLYNPGDLNVRVDGKSKLTVKGDTDLHIAGKVTGDIYGDTTLNIRQSDLRTRETCNCPMGEGTGQEYAAGGDGTLTLNVNEHTIINTREDLTVNTRKNVYVNTDGDLHAMTLGNTKVTTEGDTSIKTLGETHIESGGPTHIYGEDMFVRCNDLDAKTNALNVTAVSSNIKVEEDARIETGKNAHIRTEGTTFVYSGEETHVLSKGKVFVGATETHITSDNIMVNAKETLHLRAEKVLMTATNIDLSASEKIQVDGDSVLMKNAEISGVVSVAKFVAPRDIGEPDVEEAEAATPAEEAEMSEEAEEAETAETAEKGPKEDGGNDGWFDKQAGVVLVKK